MNVLWLVNCMLPEFSEALGRPAGNTGGWLPSLVGAIRRFAPELELHILCEADGDYVAECNGVNYYSFKAINIGPRWARSKRSAFGMKLRSLIKRICPSVIHCHGTENGYLDFHEDVLCGIPVVVSLQGIINGYYPHYLGGLTARRLRPYRNVIRNVLTGHNLEFVADSWRKDVSSREIRCLDKANCVAGRTDWDCAWAKALAPNAKYYHVGEILRPEFYVAKRNVGSAVHHSILASAALKYPLKGGHWLLEAVAFLKRDFPDVTVRFVDAQRLIEPKLMADKIRMTEYHKFIKTRISELDLVDNVVLLPSLNAKEVVEELYSAEVFCLPSLVENSPNSLGEAQVVGVPCVATDVGGVSSMLENEKTGLLVPSGDAASLAYAIRRLFENKTLASRLAKEARRVALERHNPERVVSELKACYEEVMDK